ncbi:hypothetical protein FRC05_010016 [Tulasnella sp. 425]|nr:hypothetical protein FRC05_010016 [Tulasnella sp. 425]
MSLCPELADTGTCSQFDCKSSHDTSLFCADCNVLCMSRYQLNSHLQGKKHQRVKQSRANASGHFCSICNMVVGTNPVLWSIHTESKRHQKKVRALGTTVANGGSSNSETWCDVCGVCVPSMKLVETHRESSKHKKRVLLAEGSSTCLFFVDVDTISEAFSRATEIKITASSPHCRLVSVRFLSSGTAVGRQSSFYIGVTAPIRLHTDDPFDLPIVFEPAGQRGYFTDTVELNFENTDSGQEWKVSRTIRVTVGVLADHALLQPVAPYVRPPRRTAPRVRDALPGPLPPSKSTIPYVKLLPRYPLVEAYATQGALGQRIATIQGMLPTNVDGRTYKDLWSALLFVEEHQMRVDIEEYDLVGVPLTQHDRYFYCKFLHARQTTVGTPFTYPSSAIQTNGSKAGSTWFEKGKWDYVSTRVLPTVKGNYRILFPNASHLRGLRRPSQQDMQRIITFNHLVASNPPQLQAVTAIVNRPPGAVPFVIWGP